MQLLTSTGSKLHKSPKYNHRITLIYVTVWILLLYGCVVLINIFSFHDQYFLHSHNLRNGFYKIYTWSSLIYNTGARHERHECNTSATRVQHECNMTETKVTRVLHWQYECDTSPTRTTQVRHEWKILILITARVKTYFYALISAIWKVKDYNERNNFILRTTFW